MANISLKNGNVVLKNGNASCTCCCDYSPWEPDTSDYCIGTNFQQTRYDLNGVCPTETRPATGTSSPNWSSWQPAASQVCSGVSFNQTKYDLNGKCPPETRPATGTGTISVTLISFEATGGSIYFPQGTCQTITKTITGPAGQDGNTPVKVVAECNSTSGECQGCTGYTLNGIYKDLGASVTGSNPISVRIQDYYGYINDNVTIGGVPATSGIYTYPVTFTETRTDASGEYTGNVTVQVTCG